MRNVYRMFKQENPNIKMLIANTDILPDVRANACIRLATHAHAEAVKLSGDNILPYISLKSGHYFFKAHLWYSKAEELYKDLQDKTLAKTARDKSEAALKASRAAVQKMLL